MSYPDKEEIEAWLEELKVDWYSGEDYHIVYPSDLTAIIQRACRWQRESDARLCKYREEHARGNNCILEAVEAATIARLILSRDENT